VTVLIAIVGSSKLRCLPKMTTKEFHFLANLFISLALGKQAKSILQAAAATTTSIVIELFSHNCMPVSAEMYHC